MLGESLLVVPILEPGKPTLKDPTQGMKGRWYDYHTKKEVLPEEEIEVDIDRIGCFLKGGSVMPLFEVKSYMKSSKDVKKSSINLLVGLDEEGNAKGSMYVDDGETFDYKKGEFARKNIEFKDGKLVWENTGKSEFDIYNKITKVTIMGLKDTSFAGAYLQVDDQKQSVTVVRSEGAVILEFMTHANKDWSISLQ